MNNAPAVDAAPWYFTAIVAGITAGAALIGSFVTAWITNREARKRLEVDLGSRREDERLKLLYDRRVTLYSSVAELLDHVTTIYSQIESAYVRVLQIHYIPDDVHATISARIEELRDVGRSLSALIYTALITASTDVVQVIQRIKRDTYTVADLMENLHSANRWAEMDFDKIVKYLTHDHGTCIVLMSRDLGIDRSREDDELPPGNTADDKETMTKAVKQAGDD
jgi:hypothetical protein